MPTTKTSLLLLGALGILTLLIIGIWFSLKPSEQPMPQTKTPPPSPSQTLSQATSSPSQTQTLQPAPESIPKSEPRDEADTVQGWQRIIEPTSGVAFTIPTELVTRQSKDSIFFFDPKHPTLPPLFIASVITTPTELKTLSHNEALQKIAQIQLGHGIIRITNFYNGGVEVEASTFTRYYFFIYNPSTNRAVEFTGRKEFLASLQFREIVRLTEL